MKRLAHALCLLLLAFVLLFLVICTAYAQDQQGGDGATQSIEPQSLGAPTADAADTANETSLPGGGRIGPDYVLGPEDVVGISVFGVPDLSETARIENDGFVEIKLLGRVNAAGMTTTQLQQELRTRWGKDYLENPQVTIFIKEFHSRPVSVIGAVEKPGIYQLPGERSLIEVLSLAGGLAKRGSGAAGRYVYITRKAPFQDLPDVRGVKELAPDQVEVDLKQLLYSHDTALNLKIEPFDVVSVSRAGVVYVVGAVKKPGGFILEDRENVTVLQALAMAEGFQGSPMKKGARVFRRGEDGSLNQIPVDLGKVMKGKGDDILLSGNDILVVPDSTGKSIGKRSIESAISLLSGIAIYRGL